MGLNLTIVVRRNACRRNRLIRRRKQSGLEAPILEIADFQTADRPQALVEDDRLMGSQPFHFLRQEQGPPLFADVHTALAAAFRVG